jgi:WD40 repeat protein/Tfp pilus assembly protein PilF
MGIVYEAEQLSLGRRVALKVLPLHGLLSPAHIKRFQLEARAAAHLHHPNIVSVYDVGEANGIHYYAMQFIHGQGLDQVLEEVRRLRELEDGGRRVLTAGARASARDLSVPAALLSGAALRQAHEEAHQEGNADGGYAALAADRSASGTARAPPTAGDQWPERRHGSSSSLRLPGSDCASPVDTAAGYFRSVAEIGAQVADALAHAHAAGVIHRDIKPSNLLLDLEGTVWVTDFGLAKTEGDEALTQSGDVVGTLRYMGPERFKGWTDARSDVYSLGATLYELLTLRPAFVAGDRVSLIEKVLNTSPPQPRRLDPRVPRDIETIVLKAMQKEPAQRYGSAGDLAADLRRFSSRLPIVARRTPPLERIGLWFQRNPLVAGLTALITAVVFSAAVVASGLAFKLSAEKRAAVANLRQAYLGEAMARRSDPRPGRRHETLRVIDLASRIEPGLDLRNEAIAALALHDLHPIVKEWRVGARDDKTFLAFDAALSRLAYSDAGSIHIVRVADRAEIGALPFGWWMLFSAGGRYLASLAGSTLRVRDFEKGVDLVLEDVFHFDFAVADEHLLATVSASGTVQFLRLPEGKVLGSFSIGSPVRRIRLDPRGDRLAVSPEKDPHVQIRDVAGGNLVRRLAAPEEPYALAWEPRGRLLAAGSHLGVVRVWSPETGEELRQLHGHTADVVRAEFSGDGELLASFGYDKKTIIWDPWIGTRLLEYEGQLGRFSAHGASIGFGFEGSAAVFEVTRPALYRRLHGRLGAETRTLWRPVFDPREQWVAAVSGEDDGVHLWEAASGREVAFLPLINVYSASFVRGGAELITSGDLGIHAWPIRISPSRGGAHEIGPPRPLRREPAGMSAMLGDGERLVFVGGSRPRIIDLRSPDPPKERSFDFHLGLASISVSPDGRWIAGGAHHASGIPIWDTTEAAPGPVVKVLPAPWTSYPCFSPDGRWLVTSDGLEYRFYTVGTWEEAPGRRVPMHRVGEPPGSVAFSRDGLLLALMRSLTSVSLIEVQGGNEVASLEAPHEETITGLCFSPSGRFLAATTRRYFVHLWDLQAMRRELRSLRLDWDTPAASGLPPAPSAAPPTENPIRPFEIIVNLGDLEARIFAERGRLAESRMNLARALEDYEHVLALEADRRDVQIARAHLLRRLGSPADSIAAFEAALALDPDDPRVLDALAWTHVLAPAELRRPEHAVNLARRAVAKAPLNRTYLCTLGAAQVRAGRLEDAVATLEAALRGTDGPVPRDSISHLLLSLAKASLGRNAEAREHCERALRVRTGAADEDFESLLEEVRRLVAVPGVGE